MSGFARTVIVLLIDDKLCHREEDFNDVAGSDRPAIRLGHLRSPLGSMSAIARLQQL